LARARTAPSDVFINVPFDAKYENTFLALIASLVGLGLNPRCVLEVPPGIDRLRRLYSLILSCPFSLHDLSRGQVGRTGPFRVPRFNMPFTEHYPSAPEDQRTAQAISCLRQCEQRADVAVVIGREASRRLTIDGAITPSPSGGYRAITVSGLDPSHGVRRTGIFNLQLWQRACRCPRLTQQLSERRVN
jgi:hypothetical protein